MKSQTGSSAGPDVLQPEMRWKPHGMLLLLFVAGRIPAQNLDIGYCYSSGPYRGMAGAGIGIADPVSAFDLNPAGPAGNLSKITLSLSQNLQSAASIRCSIIHAG